MTVKSANTGKPFELQVADAYRVLGARRVEHDKEIAGQQIDVYVEFDLPDSSIHRLAVEAKDYGRPIGIEIVRDFSHVLSGLHRLRHIDEGVIVSIYGYTKPARNRAAEERIRLTTLSDLETIKSEAKQIRASIDELSLRLKPFEELAAKLHPNLRINEALQELRQDIERLRGIAAKHEFTPLTDQKRQTITEQLRILAPTFNQCNLHVLITYETWVPAPTRAFAEQLTTLLQQGGVNTAGPEFATVYLASPAYPLEWGFNEEEEEIVNTLYSVLSQVIEPSDKHGIRRSFAKGKIRIHFAGQAIFQQDGSVSIQ